MFIQIDLNETSLKSLEKNQKKKAILNFPYLTVNFWLKSSKYRRI